MRLWTKRLPIESHVPLCAEAPVVRSLAPERHVWTVWSAARVVVRACAVRTAHAAGAALLSAVVAAALARPAQAQTLEVPRPRQGYYLGGGLNLLATDVIDHGEPQGLWFGSSVSARVGQMLTKNLGLGLYLDYGGTAKSPMSTELGGLALEGQWELIENLALRGAAGFTVLGVYDSSDPDAETSGAYGGGYTAALSYDFFLWRSDVSGGLSLQPYFGVRYLPDDTISLVTASFGVELMWWSGLPNNQLQFAPGEGYEKR
ncbi:MAG: hypothetical protein JW940_06695 [Polyangiaceae bacterium]|nr:hypothetical protein [Polyangiaceae bacterium]